MPAPLILGGIAVALGATGVASGVKGLIKNRDAKQINESAQDLVNRAKKSAEAARKASGTSLETLGETKLAILDQNMNQFLMVFNHIHSIEMESSAGLEEMKYCIDQQGLVQMRELTDMAVDTLKGIGIGGATGALTAFGAYSATMMFGAASTGTAIASLSGVAATNATLAFLGGGALAAGGGGMALGSVVLGGAVAGPALAVLGIVMNASANKNLDNANTNKAKAEEIAAELNTVKILCSAISARADLYTSLLKKLDEVFGRLVRKLITIVLTNGTDYSQYSEENKSVVRMALSLAGAIKKVLDTPILDKNGNLTAASGDVYTEMFGYVGRMTNELTSSNI